MRASFLDFSARGATPAPFREGDGWVSRKGAAKVFVNVCRVSLFRGAWPAARLAPSTSPLNI